MRIGLIDVDGHNFPNLALMRISTYHKARGDEVEWWWTDFIHYDIVYKSKVFSDTYSPDVPDPLNADKIIKGGTGYCITTVDGKEVYDKSKDSQLQPEIERCFPDYSIYPQYKFAVALTSRGCPRKCPFCHVFAKEGGCHKVADVADFWNRGTGKREIEVLDPNILACRDKRDLLEQYAATGCAINFNQGLDIRLINDDDIAVINRMRIKQIHFAWDNPKDNLEPFFTRYAQKAKHKPHGRYGDVYVLTNYNSTMDEDLHRVYTLRGLGYDPYVMIYDKPNAPRETRLLQRWCNNKIIFGTIKSFDEYDPKIG